jgi:hypothetical protein
VPYINRFSSEFLDLIILAFALRGAAMNPLMKSLHVLFIIAGMTTAFAVHAEACTYNEALIAFQQGNAVRGQALLTMAAKDGDPRAVAMFAAIKETLSQDYDAEDAMRMVLATTVSPLSK